MAKPFLPPFPLATSLELERQTKRDHGTRREDASCSALETRSLFIQGEKEKEEV